jgi:hypothetical protein
VAIERLYALIARPTYKELQIMTYNDLDNYIESEISSSLNIVIASICIFILLPSLIWKPIVMKILRRYEKLKMLLKRVPPDVILDQKNLYYILMAFSPKLLRLRGNKF